MNTDTALVSVIVPCYNYGMFLKESLDSVLEQTYNNWECIIVDNASTDNTKEIVFEYIEKDSRFSYVYQDVKGVSAARNKGIKNSRGKYILPLDADDKIAKSYIQKAVSVFEKDSEIKIVYCEAELFGDSSKKWKLPTYSFDKLLKENIIFCTALYSRMDFDVANGYDETFLIGFEDWDFWLSLLSKGGNVFQIKETLFFYRIRKSSRNNSLSIEQQKELRRRIVEKHKDLYKEHFNTSDLIFDSHLYESKYKAMTYSLDSKIGKIVLSPVRLIRRIFKK